MPTAGKIVCRSGAGSEEINKKRTAGVMMASAVRWIQGDVFRRALFHAFPVCTFSPVPIAAHGQARIGKSGVRRDRS